jgi:hypothetical protein
VWGIAVDIAASFILLAVCVYYLVKEKKDHEEE